MALPVGRMTVFDISLPGIAGPDVPPYAARGLQGTLRPIDMAQGPDKLRRTVNGTLVDVSAPQMRKYQLEITGNDQQPPALDGIWPGMQVSVYSNVEVAYHTATGMAERPAVPGSVRVEGDWTFYCPAFEMRAQEWQIERSEWEQAVTWGLTLVEV